eukprot:m.233439 g.233439  ORF g.233439 m.233439 type:complete len:500 (-) comp54294_c0_seq4:46-1545(-)
MAGQSRDFARGLSGSQLQRSSTLGSKNPSSRFSPTPTSLSPSLDDHITVDSRISSQIQELEDQCWQRIQRCKYMLSDAQQARDGISVDVEKELKKSFETISTYAWSGTESNTRQIKETASTAYTATLSPLGLQAIIDERNELRKRVRDAASHVKRLQSLRRIELDAQRQEITLELLQEHSRQLTLFDQSNWSGRPDTAKLALSLFRVRVEVEKDARLHAVQVARLCGQHETLQANASQRDKEQTSSNIDLKQEITSKQEVIESLRDQIRDLYSEIDHVRSEGKAALALHLEEQHEQLTLESIMKQEAALNALRDDLRLEKMRELQDQREHLTKQFEHELNITVDMYLGQQYDDLQHKHRKEKMKAVSEAKSDALRMMRDEEVTPALKAREQMEEYYDKQADHLRQQLLERTEEARHLRRMVGPGAEDVAAGANSRAGFSRKETQSRLLSSQPLQSQRMGYSSRDVGNSPQARSSAPVEAWRPPSAARTGPLSRPSSARK